MNGHPSMLISSAQCRAARALLDWSQDQLAENAQVSRATVADFERNNRTPVKNNLIAIIAALEAAGVSFIPDSDQGVGVRFRKVELEYNKTIRPLDIGPSLSVRYKQKPYTLVIPGEVLDDIDRTNYDSLEEQAQAVSRHLPLILRAAEEAIVNGRISDHDFVVLDHGKFPDGIF